MITFSLIKKKYCQIVNPKGNLTLAKDSIECTNSLFCLTHLL